MNRLTYLILPVLAIWSPGFLSAATLEVGPGKPYANPAQAAQNAEAGDTVLIFPATYTGTYFIEDLHGNAGQWITFRGTNKSTVIFQGGTEAMHFIDVSYIRIENMTIRGQTGNGINIDDGGSFETPAHHVVVFNMAFADMGAQGNNDMLKLSGLDQFEVAYCSFVNGAQGGSGIDMVGCHWGNLHHNSFQQMGSNCIQAKGGSRYLRIANSHFTNGGQRTLNLGGSTDLEFFRPQDATFEAADIQVYANIIRGSWSPIAYVGSVRVDVANNTIVFPQNWIIRILQETVDPDRFEPCGQNWFRNNIVYYTNSLSTDVNIGPNTAPATFIFSNNLWYNADSPGSSQPVLPVAETNAIIGQHPLFTDINANNFHLQSNSPAAGAGVWIEDLGADIDGALYNNPPTLGAYELNPASSTREFAGALDIQVYPNPVQSQLTVDVPEATNGFGYEITDRSGRVIEQGYCGSAMMSSLYVSHYPAGVYFITIKTDRHSGTTIFIKTK